MSKKSKFHRMQNLTPAYRKHEEELFKLYRKKLDLLYGGLFLFILVASMAWLLSLILSA